MKKTIRYKDAGVNIDTAAKAVERIKSMVRTTFTPQVLTDLGKFGGFYSMNLSRYQHPVLVSSIDGVGTKLKVAFKARKYNSIGEDLVNHCVNDILVGGARPLFFLDYIGTGFLKSGVIEEVVEGMVRGCKNSQCALIGGEMAEMPGFYQKDEFDLVGSIVGVVDKEQIIDGQMIQEGDVLIGLPSNGLHTNGYSLARKVLFERSNYSVETYVEELGITVGEELLKVHRCYCPMVSPLLEKIEIKGMSHVTGGGIINNTQRILPDGYQLHINWDSWERPQIFHLIQKLGHVPEEEMRRTFNLGIGFILIISEKNVSKTIGYLSYENMKPIPVGEVIKFK